MTEAITFVGLVLEIAVLGSIISYPPHGSYPLKLSLAGVIAFIVAVSAIRLARVRQNTLWLLVGIVALSPILFLAAIYYLYRLSPH